MSLEKHSLVADWLTAQDGKMFVHTGKVDIGQRISTAMAQIVHEELTIPLDQICVAPVRTGQSPDEGMTSGSNSVVQSGHAVRCASATLALHLRNRAISAHGGAQDQWQFADGTLCNSSTGLKLEIIELMQDVDLTLKVDPNAGTLTQGDTGLPRPPMRGLPEIVTGQYEFIHDLDAPGMHHARVVRPPHVGATLVNVPEKAIQSLTADEINVTRDGSFVAVSGPQEWPVVQAALKLATAIEWDLGDGASERDVFKQLSAENAQRLLVKDGTPTADPIPDAPTAPDMSARYERPYQLHGSLGPSAGMAVWQNDKLIIHSQSQGIYPLRDSIAKSLGLVPEQVDITHVPGSGCYGHNGADDAAFEAALIAMATPGIPILLKWTREDEHKWEPYASAMAVELSANLTGGRITDYSAEAFSDTHRGRPRPGPGLAGSANLLANWFRADPIGPIAAQPTMGRELGIHRNLDPIYNFEQKRLVKSLVSGLPHRVSAMRCLGGAANVFALECFMDEVALGQNADPIAYRKSHMNNRRDHDVLDELQTQLAAIPKATGRGIAYARYKNQMARVTVGVDIDTNDKAEVFIRSAVIVADAGRIIDVDGLSAQLEGGFIQAASWALYEQVAWDRDGISSTDWKSYPVVRFGQIPDIKVVCIDKPREKSVGAGEASPGPSIAAIGNAIFDATGIRMRRMPFSPAAILQAAYDEQ